MTYTFDPTGRAVFVDVWITGPTRTQRAQLRLDTGATHTLIRATMLELVGFRPEDMTRPRRFRSATGGGAAPTVVLRQLLALGVTETDFRVTAYDPPPAVTADGLLGLDFLRGRVLTLDFARGRVGLRGPRTWWPWG
jgi:hypothetical protein